MLRYSSRAICRPSSTSTRPTTRPSGPVWWVTSVMPIMSRGELLGFVGRLGELDAAALAAAAGVNLRLDDDDGAAEAPGDLAGFGGVEGDFAARHGHAVPREDGFGLILVNFHDGEETPDASRRTRARVNQRARRLQDATRSGLHAPCSSNVNSALRLCVSRPPHGALTCRPDYASSTRRSARRSSSALTGPRAVPLPRHPHRGQPARLPRADDLQQLLAHAR